MPTEFPDDITLSGNLICTVDIDLSDKAPITVGQTPWRNRRVSDIVGGHFDGPRMKGTVLPSGADWSEGGWDVDGNATTLLDIRSVWQADDGPLIYVVYSGRLVIPKGLLDDFRDPAKVDDIDPASYYFRITPTFETSSPTYDWLNNIVCVGLGKRTSRGVRYRIFAVN